MLAHDLNNGLAVALGNMTYLEAVVPMGSDESAAMSATRRARCATWCCTPCCARKAEG
jgi:hypothetical protein